MPQNIFMMVLAHGKPSYKQFRLSQVEFFKINIKMKLDLTESGWLQSNCLVFEQNARLESQHLICF